MLATPELIAEAAREGQLGKILDQARRIPLYRSRLCPGSLNARRAWADLPFITKRDMRDGFPKNFLPEEQSLDALLEQNAVELEHTSGTSQERTPVLFRRGWWDEQEQRALRLNPLVARLLADHPKARRVTMTTPSCNDRSCPTVWQSVEQRTIGNARYVNIARMPFTLSEAELNRMAAEIVEWAPLFLDVSPVHAMWFALHCERHGLRFPSVRFILCSYEFCSVVHRRILQRAFGVPVLDLYGSTETGHLLMETTGHRMKPALENAVLEVVEPDVRGVGELVVTTLTNDYMPLLRYRIGDLAGKTEQPYATFYHLHGRLRDCLLSANGARITTRDVDDCFEGIFGIAHYQLTQDESGSCRLRMVPDSAPVEEGKLKELVARLKALLGVSGQLTTEFVPLLLPEHSGKYRLTLRV